MARGPQRRGAQCSCIGLRPALATSVPNRNERCMFRKTHLCIGICPSDFPRTKSSYLRFFFLHFIIARTYNGKTLATNGNLIWDVSSQQFRLPQNFHKFCGMFGKFQMFAPETF